MAYLKMYETADGGGGGGCRIGIQGLGGGGGGARWGGGGEK